MFGRLSIKMRMLWQPVFALSSDAWTTCLAMPALSFLNISKDTERKRRSRMKLKREAI